MLVVEGFQKFADIPFGISRIFESLMPQQIGANRHKNRSIQVLFFLAFPPGIDGLSGKQVAAAVEVGIIIPVAVDSLLFPGVE
jgi:hypothetical protein